MKTGCHDLKVYASFVLLSASFFTFGQQPKDSQPACTARTWHPVTV